MGGAAGDLMVNGSLLHHVVGLTLDLLRLALLGDSHRLGALDNRGVVGGLIEVPIGLARVGIGHHDMVGVLNCNLNLTS